LLTCVGSFSRRSGQEQGQGEKGDESWQAFHERKSVRPSGEQVVFRL
jgi:hypothetical protein